MMSTHRRLAITLSISFMLLSLASALPFLNIGHVAATNGEDGSRYEAFPAKRYEIAALRGPSAMEAWKAEFLTTSLALSAGDLDEDGAPDTVAAESAPCRLTVQSAAGLSTLALPICADFLSTGDFDADGHLDVAVAVAGDTGFYITPGDGHGNLGLPSRIELSRTVTALAGGEINRRDGLVDLAVAVMSPTGPSLLIFESPEGAARAQTEEITLASEATTLEFGQFDTDYFRDLAVTTVVGSLVVHGRDRKLFLDPAHRAVIAPPLVTSGAPATGTPASLPAPPVATILVDSDADTNTRDSVVTLREAILIANGTLLKAALTPDEQSQVIGIPAPAQSDAINFNIPGPAPES
jgi:hypothetical protein